MNGIQNFLIMLSDNWVTILVCIGAVVGFIKETIIFFSKSTDEQIEAAKIQMKDIMLKLVTSAEIDFDSWNKAGSIKRSQVIEQIFEKYPILSKATNQEEVIKYIDDQIKESLKTLKKVIENNNSK